MNRSLGAAFGSRNERGFAMYPWSLRLLAAVLILACMAAPADAARLRSHGISFTHHTGSFSGSTSGGFSVSPHKTRVFFDDFGNNGFFFSHRTGRSFFFRRLVVLNPGPVPPFNGTNQFFSGTIVPPFTIGTPINSFFVPQFFVFRNNSLFSRNSNFNFGFFSSGFRTGRFNSFFAPVGLTGGSGNSTIILLTNPSPSVIPASFPIGASPVSAAKAQIVVLHRWPEAGKVKVFAPTSSAQASGSRSAMQIAEVPAQ